MNLGTKGRYAVMAMVELALRGEGSVVSLQLLSEAQDIPLSYLEQIFAKLKAGGLVESVRGPGGGYRLAHTASDIPILNIIEAADEQLEMTRCGKKDEGCMSSTARCLTHHLWSGLSDTIDQYFRNISLQDVCDG